MIIFYQCTQNADVIYVLKDGHVIEKGKHEELLENKGLYHEVRENDPLYIQIKCIKILIGHCYVQLHSYLQLVVQQELQKH